MNVQLIAASPLADEPVKNWGQLVIRGILCEISRPAEKLPVCMVPLRLPGALKSGTP